MDRRNFPRGDDEQDIRRVYGNPEAFLADHEPDERDFDRAWRDKILSEPIRFPSAIRYLTTNKLISRICVHKLLRPNVEAILEELAAKRLWQFVEDCGGCYNMRLMRGGKRLSTHAFAAGIDLQTARYPLGVPPDFKDPFVTKVVPVFEAHGWTWGGLWARPDVGHLQATVGA